MKKVLLVVATLLATAVVSYAVPIQGDALALTADITGWAKLTWGISFDDTNSVEPGAQYASGIQNTGNVSVTVSLVSKRTHTEKGDGAVYAQISIQNIAIALVNGQSTTDPSQLLNNLSAVLYVGPVYLDLMGDTLGGNRIQIANVGNQLNGGREGRRGIHTREGWSNNGNENDPKFRGATVGLVDTSILKASFDIASNGIWAAAPTADIPDTALQTAQIVYVRPGNEGLDESTRVPAGQIYISVDTTSELNTTANKNAAISNNASNTQASSANSNNDFDQASTSSTGSSGYQSTVAIDGAYHAVYGYTEKPMGGFYYVVNTNSLATGYDPNEANSSNIYLFTVRLGLGDKVVPGLHFDVAYQMSNDYNGGIGTRDNRYNYDIPTELGGGAVLTYTIPLAKDIGLSATVGTNYMNENAPWNTFSGNVGAADSWEITGGLDLSFPGQTITKAEFWGVRSEDLMSFKPGIGLSFATFTARYTSDQNFIPWVGYFQLNLYSGDLIKGIHIYAIADTQGSSGSTYSTGFNATNASAGSTNVVNATAWDWEAGLRVDANLGDVVKPFAEYYQFFDGSVSNWTDVTFTTDANNYFSSLNKKVALSATTPGIQYAGNMAMVKVGVEITPIKLTTFGIVYQSGNIFSEWSSVQQALTNNSQTSGQTVYADNINGVYANPASNFSPLYLGWLGNLQIYTKLAF